MLNAYLKRFVVIYKEEFLVNKERKVIESNAIIIFDRDVNSSELANLPADFQGDIVINGMLFVEEELFIKCDNLYADRVQSIGHNINIIGNLYVKDAIDIFAIEVNGSICCNEDFDSANVAVAEDICVIGDADVNGNDIFVGGDFICKGAIKSVHSMKVLGKLYVDEGII